MALSLNNFLKQRERVIKARNAWLRLRYGVRISPDVRASLSSRFVSRRRGAICVGQETLIAFNTLIISFDPATGDDKPVSIGRRCFVGGGSIIAPGVTIGDEAIVGAGAVVLDDVPPRTIVGGNPAKVLKRDIKVGAYGRLEGADDNTRRLWAN